MKLWGLVFRRRLFLRLYLYEVLVIALGFAAISTTWHTVIEPGKDRKEGATLYIGEWALRQLDTPEQLQRELATLNKNLGVRITVYTLDGHRVVSEGEPAWSSLDSKAIEHLKEKGTLELPGEGIAVLSSDATGHPAAYAMIALQPNRTTRAGRFARAAVIVLVLFALGTVPLVRSIAKPLEKLSSAARAFGAGDLSARAKLERNDEIGDLARTFDEMADSVEAFRRAEKELLANVSHELRTPLARIRVVLELAAKKFPEAGQRYVAAIDEDLGELERLIEDIIRTARLDLSNTKLGDPYPPLRCALVPIGSFVESLAENFAHVHPDRPLECHVDHEVSVVADKPMLKRAINNVIENAHKYSAPNRPITITVERDPTTERASVVIRDQGIGVDAADIPHVFTPFFRTDRSRARDTGGIGLGLSLAQRIVHAHGGSIHLSSAICTGTTVTIFLPLDGGDEEPLV